MSGKKTEKKPKRPPGRPREYEERPGKEGAPLFTTRLSPPVLRHIKSREKTPTKENPRAYIERLVTEDADRTGEVLGGAGNSRDVPGQVGLDGNEVAGWTAPNPDEQRVE